MKLVITWEQNVCAQHTFSLLPRFLRIDTSFVPCCYPQRSKVERHTQTDVITVITPPAHAWRGLNLPKLKSLIICAVYLSTIRLFQCFEPLFGDCTQHSRSSLLDLSSGVFVVCRWCRCVLPLRVLRLLVLLFPPESCPGLVMHCKDASQF